MAVRLFVGNLSYSTTEADLRTYFGTVAPPSQVVLPVDRETGRPRGFAFVEFLDRAHAEQAIQQFNGQVFNGRPLAVSEARAREDRGPAVHRGRAATSPDPGPGGGFAPRPPARSADSAAAAVRSPRPARAARAAATSAPTPSLSAAAARRAKKKDDDKPRGPIPLKNTGRSFSARRRRLAGRAVAGHRRLRHEQAARGNRGRGIEPSCGAVRQRASDRRVMKQPTPPRQRDGRERPDSPTHGATTVRPAIEPTAAPNTTSLT